jgi:hypothetical protein
MLQELTLCSTAKAVAAAAPPLYGEEEGGRSGGACCYVSSVQPQFHFTHHQLLQQTALLPRAHGIETAEVALRDHCNC